MTASCRPARSAESPSATGAMKPTERSAAARMTEGAIEVCSSAAMTPVSLTASAANWSERVLDRARRGDEGAHGGEMRLAFG